MTETRQLTGTPKSASQMLLQNASELNPEIFAVGAYSHRPLHEMIFGGVTRENRRAGCTPTIVWKDPHRYKGKPK